MPTEQQQREFEEREALNLRQYEQEQRERRMQAARELAERSSWESARPRLRR